MRLPQNPLKGPVARDTTPRSPREILRRLALVAFWLSLVLAPPLALLALAGRDEGLMNGAWISAALFVALLLARPWWNNAPPAEADSKPAPAPNPSPVPASRGGASSPGPLPRPRVLLLDASLAGPGGNSSALLDLLATYLEPLAHVERGALSGASGADFTTLEPALRAADAFVFATGTHWDSWSSALQKFLEDATPAETSSLWLGKPAAVLVTEHSVGGKAVLSRLQGVLVTLGCAIPPLSGLVIAQSAQLARRHCPDPGACEDYWSPEDLAVVAHNLLASIRRPRPEWRAWPVDRDGFRKRWLKTNTS
jgi:NAD(P)H-dependent FMN reductase